MAGLSKRHELKLVPTHPQINSETKEPTSIKKPLTEQEVIALSQNEKMEDKLNQLLLKLTAKNQYHSIPTALSRFISSCKISNPLSDQQKNDIAILQLHVHDLLTKPLINNRVPQEIANCAHARLRQRTCTNYIAQCVCSTLGLVGIWGLALFAPIFLITLAAGGGLVMMIGGLGSIACVTALAVSAVGFYKLKGPKLENIATCASSIAGTIEYAEESIEMLSDKYKYESTGLVV